MVWRNTAISPATAGQRIDETASRYTQKLRPEDCGLRTADLVSCFNCHCGRCHAILPCQLLFDFLVASRLGKLRLNPDTLLNGIPIRKSVAHDDTTFDTQQRCATVFG